MFTAETPHARAPDVFLLLPTDVIIERSAIAADLCLGTFLAAITGTRRKTGAGVDDPSPRRNRRAAHVQRARAVNGDIARLRQRHAREVESIDAELGERSRDGIPRLRRARRSHDLHL